MKAKCYFSYCWDNDDLYAVLEFLKSEIEKKSNERIEVILDKKDFEVGDDFEEKEKQILECDSVVLFFTPEFKRIIQNMDRNRCVYREYEYVRELLTYNPKALIPALFSGEIIDAVPNEYSKLIATNLANVRLHQNKNGSYTVDKKNRAIVNHFTSFVVYKTEANFSARDYVFDNEDDEISQLLYITKANEKLPRDCMIKVDAYEEIMNQRSCFVIGRKGSGKSTLFEILKKMNPETFQKKYKILSPINADSFELFSLYSIIDSLGKDEKYLSIEKILDLFWQLYFGFYSMYIVCLEEEHQKIHDTRQKIFRRVSNKLKSRLNVKNIDNDYVRANLFTIVVETLDEYVSVGLMDYANSEYFFSSILANFTVENALKSFLGKDLFFQYQTAIKKCKKRIMISLDGFDASSDNFRIEANNYAKSSEFKEKGLRMIWFEQLFYRNLVTTVEKIKNKFSSNYANNLFHIVDFCIVLPQDRLDLIETVDRDFSKRHFCSLYWDAYDLLEMLVLRLEHMKSIEKDESLDLKERFQRVLLQIPFINETVRIDIDGQSREISLFNYILRLSFWRPRDILKHFACLLDLSQKMKNERNGTVDNDTIKNLLSRSADKIIRDEFIKEYDKVFINIKDVLHSFDDMDLINSPDIICDVLSQTKFLTNFSFDMDKIENKLLILYQLGVLGLLFDEKDARKLGFGHKMCFHFNEGISPINFVQEKPNSTSITYSFIFNPIFCKFLQLNINSKDLIGDFKWEYFLRVHQLRSAIERI